MRTRISTRLAALTTLIVAGCLLGPIAPALTAPIDNATASGDCVWTWHKKRIVKHVKRHGKRHKVVKIKHYRTCDPIPPPTGPARLGVKAFEYRFSLSRVSTVAGDTIVELNNQGEDPHNLNIARVDGTGPTTSFAETPSLELTTERFTTKPGTYKLWCSLPTHEGLGMKATLTVTRKPKK